MKKLQTCAGLDQSIDLLDKHIGKDDLSDVFHKYLVKQGRRSGHFLTNALIKVITRYQTKMR